MFMFILDPLGRLLIGYAADKVRVTISTLVLTAEWTPSLLCYSHVNPQNGR